MELKIERKLFRLSTDYVVDGRTIRKALGIGRDQKFRERCILDAELVLWDRDEQKIQEFYQLSSYVFNNKR